MSDVIRIVDVNDDGGNAIATDWLLAAEKVHRQLRPQLPQDYNRKMHRVFAGGGRMCVATRGSVVVGVAVYRIHENTVDDIQMYVDDLVTDENQRSQRVGNALMAHLQQLARDAGCEKFTLDSGTQRQQAHKFYFREGMVVTAFHFVKSLDRTGG